ncbi:SIR2 family protein, partial [Saccharibacter floricola]
MPLRYVDTKNSVLFLGSGFSKFATNILNETLPDGQELFKKLSDILNADVNGYDLKSISDMLMDEKKESIFDVLYKTFTVARTSNFQHAILSLPWGRIYTTNYDDIIQNIKGSEFKCFTFYDDVPKKLPKSFSIYLHGSISRVNEEDFSDKIILNNSSYDSINREHIQWLDEFKSDIRNFNACFFLGYSLRDHHISSLLSLSLKDTKKVCFIAGKNAPKHFIKRAAEYGEVLPIDFDVFAKKIKEAPTPEKPQDLNKLPSFRYLHPGLDSKSHSTPTPTEINNLVCFGTFYKERFFSLKDIKDFVIIRKRKVDDVIKHLSDKKTILIHSRIGNGKTIFLYIFTYMVKSFSYHCLFWKGRNRCFSQELELIKKYNKVIVIFDDYDEAINNIEKISSEAPDVKFIVTMRTSLQEVRLHEIKEKLPSPLQRIDINTLSSEEKNDFYNLLYKNGAQKQNLEHSIKNKSRDIRDIVTKLYEHKEIRKKILNICDSLSSTLRETVIILSLAKWSGITVDDSTINYILKKDVFLDIKDPNNHSINDLIEFNEEKIDMRSSMLSEYIIQHMLDTDHVLNICQKIIICLTNKKHKNNYRK